MDRDTSGTSAPVQPGDVLAGKYEVTHVLGAGGMGVVVAARHLHLKGRVAIKFLLPEVAKNPEVVARFLREAQAATRIGSEHVTRVLDVGTLESGAPYMVMEFLEGRDLGQCLAAEGSLSVESAVDFLLQAMEALAEAHAAGIVHRDLKPSNLFLTRRADGSPLVKVLDFGISKALTGDPADSQLTHTQGFMGSPLYMSPEQIRSSKHVDARADVWSLGVILYELLSGGVPFTGDTAAAVLATIVADPHTPLDRVRPDMTPALARIVDRCLEKWPDRRYPSVAELAIDLAPFGSRDAEVSRTRITGVLYRGRQPSSVDIRPAQSSPNIANSVTAAAWGATSNPQRSRARLFAAGIAGAVVLATAGLVLILALRSSPDADRAGPGASAVPVPASEITPAPAAPPSTAAPPAASAAAARGEPVAPSTDDAGSDAKRAMAPTRTARQGTATPKTGASTSVTNTKPSSGKQLDGLIEDRR